MLTGDMTVSTGDAYLAGISVAQGLLIISNLHLRRRRDGRRLPSDFGSKQIGNKTSLKFI